MVPRAIAVAVLALAATLSLSTTASADEYPPDDLAAVAVVACSGQYVAEPGYFAPGETVMLTVTGANAESIALAPAALRAKTFPAFTAAADGSLVVDIRNGARTTGDFELTTSGTESPTRGPLLFSLTASCNPTADGALPFTGADLTPAWLGGGMLIVGALALGGVYAVRRQRRS